MLHDVSHTLLIIYSANKLLCFFSCFCPYFLFNLSFYFVDFIYFLYFHSTLHLLHVQYYKILLPLINMLYLYLIILLTTTQCMYFLLQYSMHVMSSPKFNACTVFSKIQCVYFLCILACVFILYSLLVCQGFEFSS